VKYLFGLSVIIHDLGKLDLGERTHKREFEWVRLFTFLTIQIVLLGTFIIPQPAVRYTRAILRLESH